MRRASSCQAEPTPGRSGHGGLPELPGALLLAHTEWEEGNQEPLGRLTQARVASPKGQRWGPEKVTVAARPGRMERAWALPGSTRKQQMNLGLV